MILTSIDNTASRRGAGYSGRPLIAGFEMVRPTARITCAGGGSAAMLDVASAEEAGDRRCRADDHRWHFSFISGMAQYLSYFEHGTPSTDECQTCPARDRRSRVASPFSMPLTVSASDGVAAAVSRTSHPPPAQMAPWHIKYVADKPVNGHKLSLPLLRDH